MSQVLRFHFMARNDLLGAASDKFSWATYAKKAMENRVNDMIEVAACVAGQIDGWVDTQLGSSTSTLHGPAMPGPSQPGHNGAVYG